jgi:hypothetical protein
MKYAVNGLILFVATFFTASFAWADSTIEAPPTTNELKTPVVSESNYSQIFTIQVGQFVPGGIAVSNGDYKFDYDGDSLNSYIVQMGWALHLLDFGGSWYLEQNLGFTSFKGSASSTVEGKTSDQTMQLYVLPIDIRLMYAMDWFPWKRLIPFVDGGYQYAFYSQMGNSDLDSAQGSVGNFVTGFGVRYWLNRGRFSDSDYSTRFSSIPIMLTAKVNWIMPNQSQFDLSSTTFLAGLAIAL